MIRVTVELLSARTGKKTLLGVMDICNRGNRPHNSAKGDYDGYLYRKGQYGLSPKSMRPVPLKKGEIIDWPRKSYPVWRLVCRMLKEMFPEEK